MSLKQRLGLLDQPEILHAMLTGRTVVATMAGRLIGVYDSEGEALERAMRDDTPGRVSITPPAKPEQVEELQRRTLMAIARREREGRPFPEAIIAIAATFPPGLEPWPQQAQEGQ
jgi:hypothetical protein